MSDSPLIVVARVLLPAGEGPLAERGEVRSGGLDSTQEWLSDAVSGAFAVIADPTVPVTAELLDAAGPQLKVIANFAVGTDNIDLNACEQRSVTVTNTPDVLTNATAELALALTLAAARLLTAADAELRAGRWRGWDPAAFRGLELSGATVGVIGLGRIGGRYAQLLRGLEPELLYSGAPRPEAEASIGARNVGFEELLSRADVVSLHAPGRRENHGLIGVGELALMKKDAILINTARGALVDSVALASALEEGRIGAAGLDVFENEPEVPAALLAAPRTVLSPHIGSATVKARDDMARTVAANVLAVLDGAPPPNPVRA